MVVSTTYDNEVNQTHFQPKTGQSSVILEANTYNSLGNQGLINFVKSL